MANSIKFKLAVGVGLASLMLIFGTSGIGIETFYPRMIFQIRPRLFCLSLLTMALGSVKSQKHQYPFSAVPFMDGLSVLLS